MYTNISEKIDVTLNHHLQALGQGDFEAILSDYAEDSVLFTPNGPVRGLEELRAFFADFLANTPPEFMQGLQILRQDCVGETAYVLWKSEKFAPLGTDTFIIRQGKIIVQTFAAYMLP